MKKLNKNHLLLFGLILSFLPYLYLSFFTNPSIDDFVFSNHFQERKSFYDLLKNAFLGWNGRYASNIFVYLNPLGFGSISLYKLVSVFTILLIVLSNYFFIKELLFRSKTVVHLLLSLILSILFLNNMPIISEGIYWYTGLSIYTLGVIFSFTYLGLLLRQLRKEKSIGGQFLISVMLFVSCGFNEVLSLLIVVLLGCVTMVSYKQNFEMRKTIRSQFLFAFFFTCLLVFAPGNGAREDIYANNHNLWNSVLYSMAQVGRFFTVWIVSLPLLISSVLYFSLNNKLCKEYVFFKKSFYLNKWVSLSLLFLIVFICVFPPYWATGILGQHRTLNVAYAFFLPLWFINLTVWFNSYKQELHVVLSRQKRIYLAVILILSIVVTSNGYYTLSDIFSGNALENNRQQENRYRVLQSENLEKQIVFAPLVKARCLFVSDITDNSNNWKNQAYNLYFRGDSSEIYLK